MTDLGEPTIERLKTVQAQLGMTDTHLCWLGERTFVLAHTDEERATIDLEDCELHQWLIDCTAAPAVAGYYSVEPHIPDLDSEPYGVAPWQFLSMSRMDRGPWLAGDGQSWVYTGTPDWRADGEES
jgi:hypothetical protein